MFISNLKPDLSPTETLKNGSTLGLSEFLQIPETRAARIPEYLGDARSGYLQVEIVIRKRKQLNLRN